MNPDSITCPICGAFKINSFEARAYDSSIPDQSVSIRACDACDFAWQWPLGRSADQSKEFFQSEYQAERKESYFDKERRREIASLQLDFLTSLNVQSHTLLDIGCGDGIFASESAKCGWNVIGLDPATPTIDEHAVNPPNLKLVNGTLDDLGPDEKFICVTMWDVVEHLPDPVPLLRNAWERVLPGGWLILETGNYQSAERLLAGGDWWAWQLDHRWYFSPSTLLHLLTPLGYSEFRLAERVMRPWSSGTVNFRAPSKLQTVLSLAKRPWKRAAIISEHAAKREAMHRWPDWAGLQIFALAVKK